MEGFSEEATNILPPSERRLGSGPVRGNGINPVAEAVRSGQGLRSQLGFCESHGTELAFLWTLTGVSPESIAAGGVTSLGQ